MKSTECQYSIAAHKELGRGGTAVVYEIFDEQLKQNIALKKGLDSNHKNNIDFSALAQREFALIGELNYPGLVNILKRPDSGYNSLTLELCRGKTLEDIGRVEDITHLLNTLSAVCVNFEYLKLNQIIHGDIKPDNIFIPDDLKLIGSNSLWYAKLSDFSLGRFEHESENYRAGLGTIGFMAPETIENNITSYKSDLFALGVIAYQLITGVHPFISNDDVVDPVRINSLIRETDPVGIKELRPDIPDDLCNIVNELLTKDVTKRTSSALSICTRLRYLGATYPFEKAIQPKHCLSNKLKIEEIIDKHFILDKAEKDQLLFLSHNDTANFRQVVSYNFIRGNISLSDSKFIFNDKVYTPPRLIRIALKKFLRMSYSDKKAAIKNSLIGLNESNSDIYTLMHEVLPHFLNSKTIIDNSKRLLRSNNLKGEYGSLTRLALYAGDLDRAEEYCYQAANHLINENKNKQAHQIINRVIDFAKLIRKEFKARSLLMLLGDNLKTTGEVSQAEEVYHQLINLYTDKPADMLLAETYKDLGDIYKMKHNFNDGLNALNQAIDIYQTLDNELELSHTYNNLGNIHWLRGDLNQALNIYLKALRIQRKLKAEKAVASTLNNIGSIYVIKGRYDRALLIQKLSLELKKEIGDKGEIARTLNNIGFTYYVTGRYDQAVIMIKESLELNKNIGSQKEIMFNLENLSGIMIRAGRIKESIPYLKEGTDLSRQLNDIPHEGIFSLNTAKVLYYLGRVPEAVDEFEKTKNLNNQIDDFILNSNYYCEMSRFHNLYGSTQKAIEYANIALESGRKCGDQGVLIDSLLLLVALEGKQENIKEAQELIEKSNQSREKSLLLFSQLENSLNSDKNTDFDLDFHVTLLDGFVQDIEASALLYNLGVGYLNQNDNEKAITLFNKCQQNSNNIGFLLYQMKSLIRIGEIQFDKKMYEECYENLQKALGLFRTLSDSISDADLKKSFQSIPEIKILAEKIKELKSAIKKG